MYAPHALEDLPSVHPVAAKTSGADCDMMFALFDIVNAASNGTRLT
jgi:hypothetical protein